MALGDDPGRGGCGGYPGRAARLRAVASRARGEDSARRPAKWTASRFRLRRSQCPRRRARRARRIPEAALFLRRSARCARRRGSPAAGRGRSFAGCRAAPVSPRSPGSGPRAHRALMACSAPARGNRSRSLRRPAARCGGTARRSRDPAPARRPQAPLRLRARAGGRARRRRPAARCAAPARRARCGRRRAPAPSGPPTADFGRDVQHDGAEGGAAHARVGDAHHVLHALLRQLLRDRQVAGLGHAGRAARAGVAQHEHVVGGDVESRVVDALGQVLAPTRRRRRGRCASSAPATPPTA